MSCKRCSGLLIEGIMRDESGCMVETLNCVNCGNVVFATPGVKESRYSLMNEYPLLLDRKPKK